MKYLVGILAIAVLIVAPTAVQNAYAQLEFSVGAGVNTPVGEYGDEMKTGWAFTTGLGYRVASFLAVGAEVTVNGNKATDEVSESLGVSYDVSASIQQYALMAKLLLPLGTHNVYGKGVAGSYRGVAKASGPLGSASVENTDPGFGIGGGLLLNGEKNASFFFDVMYHNVKYDGADASTNFVTYMVGGVFSINLFD